MESIFIRSKNNPILKPDPKHDWESLKVYNPGSFFEDGVYHLFYRARGKDWVSTIGYAKSANGKKFKRFNTPLITAPKKAWSVEDPRISKIGSEYFLAYSYFDGRNVTLNLATSSDLKSWDHRGEMLPKWDLKKARGFVVELYPGQDEAVRDFTPKKRWLKAGGIFPGKIKNKYWMLFGDSHIWLATSSNGVVWKPILKPFIKARGKNFFDEKHIEMGPPPIKTEKGWLVLYHGIDKKLVYRLGFLILDLNNPTKIVYRSPESIFEPKEQYELSGAVDILPGGWQKMEKMGAKELKKFVESYKKKGLMPRVSFVNGAALVGDTLHIYYGASDSVVCTATANINDILKLVR